MRLRADVPSSSQHTRLKAFEYLLDWSDGTPLVHMSPNIRISAGNRSLESRQEREQVTHAEQS